MNKVHAGMVKTKNQKSVTHTGMLRALEPTMEKGKTVKQVVSKDGITYCVTSVPYPPEIVKSMKKAGYKVKDVPDDEPVKQKRGKK